MEKFLINGGKKLFGEVEISASKNSYLPILAGCILVDDKVVLKNYPDYSDINSMFEILMNLGANIDFIENKTIVVDGSVIKDCEVPSNLASLVRSSIFTLGALLGRFKKAKIAYPGGCEIGARPIDIHLAGFRSLGVKIIERHGYIYCDGSQMKPAKILLDFPSVGATESLMMASVFLKGETILQNCAKEPEIVDLQNFLNKMGANIIGAGSEIIKIRGVDALKGGKFEPIPDRILTGTIACAVAMCGGEVIIKNANYSHIETVLAKMDNFACQVKLDCDNIIIRADGRPKSLGKIETSPYPGVPTDLQAPLLTLQTVSEGSCMIVENLFESRYKHVPELLKMGADIQIKDRIAIVRGVEKLYGAEVFGADLRGTAGLVLAGLVAEGYTTVRNIHHIDRGYEKIENIFSKLGADIKRI